MTQIESYLVQNREHLLTQAKKLTRSKYLAEEWIQELSIIILTDFKYSGEFDHRKMNNYCWGILLNFMRESHRTNKKWVMEELDNNMNISQEPNPNPITLKRTFYEWELQKNGFGNTDIRRLSNIKFNLKELEPYELNLYKMYFEEGLVMRDIAKRCGLPLSTVWNHYKKLIDKLRRLSEKDGGVMY